MTASETSRYPGPAGFCVGQAKAGTASLHGLLAANYRSAHEPEREQTLELILRESRRETDGAAVRSYLSVRARRLGLEYDIAWANQFLIGHMLVAFPDARFIVLVRDCYTWLGSVIGHLLSRDIPVGVRTFLEWWFQPEIYPHRKHDSVLRGHGLYSITSFLHAWKRHIVT